MTDNVEHADNVEQADHADNVARADHAEHVTSAGNVTVRATQPSRLVRVLLAVAGLLLALTLAALVLPLASSVERLSEGEQLAVKERAELAAELESLDAASRCITLYEGDVHIGKALSQIALSDLLSAVVERDPALPEAERVVDNRRLIADLDRANLPLRESVAALEEYRLIDPPPGTCPHPDAD